VIIYDVYDSRMTEEAAKHFEIRTNTWDLPGFKNNYFSEVGPTLDYFRRIWGRPDRAGLRLVVVIDDEAKKPISAIFTGRTPKVAAIVYERELAKEDVDRYEFVEGSSMDLPDMTMDEIRAKYGADYWDKEWGVQKVELRYFGAYKGQYDKEPRLCITRLDATRLKLSDAEKKEDEEWKDSMSKRLSLKENRMEYKPYTSSLVPNKWRFLPDWDSGPRQYGRVSVNFSTPWKADIVVSIEDWSPLKSVPDHEFDRWIVEVADRYWDVREFAVKNWDPGYVLAVETKSGNRLVGTLYDSWVLYISSNYLVSISCKEGKIRAKDLAKIYAKELPSTLTKDFKIDKTKWYRDEGDMMMARIKKRVETDNLLYRHQFPSWYSKFVDTFRPPGFDRTPLTENDKRAMRGKEREMYDRLSAWWQANREEIIYDNKAGRLIIPRDADAR